MTFICVALVLFLVSLPVPFHGVVMSAWVDDLTYAGPKVVLLPTATPPTHASIRERHLDIEQTDDAVTNAAAAGRCVARKHAAATAPKEPGPFQS